VPRSALWFNTLFGHSYALPLFLAFSQTTLFFMSFRPSLSSFAFCCGFVHRQSTSPCLSTPIVSSLLRIFVYLTLANSSSLSHQRHHDVTVNAKPVVTFIYSARSASVSCKRSRVKTGLALKQQTNLFTFVEQNFNFVARKQFKYIFELHSSRGTSVACAASP
jgi:hypothetical protein